LPNDITRRRFLQTSAATGALVAATAVQGEDVKPAPAPAPAPAAADAKAQATTAPATQARKLKLGVVGVADQGWYHIDTIKPLANVNIVALCDVDVRHLVRAARALPAAEIFVDFRDMLKMKELDAVLVATPDHTHAVIAGAALRAGKHVYCEKPLCHTVKEVRALTDLAQQTKLVTQMGIQIHGMDNYRRVVELIQANAIGPVREVHIWNERTHRAHNPTIITPPATFNYDLWLGPAAPRPLEADFHPYNWRRRWAFGAAMLGDIGCHLMDVAFWALDLKYPTRVTSEGAPQSDDVCTEWNIATYEFPSRGEGKPEVTMTWYDPPKIPPMRDQWKLPEALRNEAVVFIGESGMLATNYGEHRLQPEEKFKDFKRPTTRIASTPGHQAEWINACLANDPTATGAPFRYGGPLAETALLGIAAFRAAPGKPLDWDARNMRFTNAPEADKFLGYQYREGWSI
jgi:predicted dehydrogenase